MNLFIYFEFCRQDMIESFKKLCPDVKVTQSGPLNDKYVSSELSKIRVYV